MYFVVDSPEFVNHTNQVIWKNYTTLKNQIDVYLEHYGTEEEFTVIKVEVADATLHKSKVMVVTSKDHNWIADDEVRKDAK